MIILRKLYSREEDERELEILKKARNIGLILGAGGVIERGLGNRSERFNNKTGSEYKVSDNSIKVLKAAGLWSMIAGGALAGISEIKRRQLLKKIKEEEEKEKRYSQILPQPSGFSRPEAQVSMQDSIGGYTKEQTGDNPQKLAMTQQNMGIRQQQAQNGQMHAQNQAGIVAARNARLEQQKKEFEYRRVSDAAQRQASEDRAELRSNIAVKAVEDRNNNKQLTAIPPKPEIAVGIKSID